MSAFLCALALLASVAVVMASDKKPANPKLKVSSNGRYLVEADGNPFFFLGDTAWELFHRLNREEADRYLENRAAKGFTVIQAVVLAELDGLKTPNAYGEKPFMNLDASKPNEAYFKHVDYIVDKAAALGLYIGMLPTWGDKVGQYGNYFFNEENARAYGRFSENDTRTNPSSGYLGETAPPM